MNEILSNEEIDVLLDLFRSEGGDFDAAAERTAFGATPGPAGEVAARVDLLKPNRVAREQLRALERLFESASKAMTASIGDRLRMEVLCDCVATEQMRFQNWLGLLTGPVAIYLLRTAPLTAPVLFAADAGLLYAAVDRILGGSGRVERVPADFTAAEYTVADAFVGPCLDRICESLAELVELRWTCEARFTNPSLAQVVPGQDVVVCAHFQLSGDAVLGDLRLAIPFHALEPHLGRLGSPPGQPKLEPGALRAPIEDNLRDTRVAMHVQLGETTLPLHQLLGLTVGDVIPLRTRFGDPLVAPVQGRVKFRGQVGTIGPRLAFRVAEVAS